MFVCPAVCFLVASGSEPESSEILLIRNFRISLNLFRGLPTCVHLPLPLPRRALQAVTSLPARACTSTCVTLRRSRNVSMSLSPKNNFDLGFATRQTRRTRKNSRAKTKKQTKRVERSGRAYYPLVVVVVVLASTPFMKKFLARAEILG